MKANIKMVEASEKRIAKFEKAIVRYNNLVDKGIEKINKGFHTNYTRDDFEVVARKFNAEVEFKDAEIKRSNNDLFWEIIKVERNYEYLVSNDYQLERERLHLETIKAEIAAASKAEEEKIAANASLRATFATEMEDFKVQWFERMHTYYSDLYDRYWSILPKLDAAYTKAAEEYGIRRDKESRLAYENAKSAYLKIRSSLQCQYAIKAEYTAMIQEMIEKDFDRCLDKLTDTCKKYAIDEANVKVTGADVTERGFQCFVHDGKPRVIDARLIWAAEYSDCVTPHVRYIVTERKH